MADEKKEHISSITINKLDKGCTVNVEKKIPEKDAYEGYKRENKTYTADDELMQQVLAYVTADIEAEDEEDKKEGEVKLIDSNKFLGKKS